MRRFIGVIILLLCIFRLDSQNYWEQIAHYPNFQAEDIVADANGILYVSISMHKDVVSFELKQSVDRYNYLPRIFPKSPYDFSSVTDDRFSLEIDKNDELLVFSEFFGVYRYTNSKFELDTGHLNGNKIQWYYSNNLMINNKGEYFFRNLSGVYKYNELFNFIGMEEVFQYDGVVFGAAMFDCGSNYIMGLNPQRGFEVYHVNSCDKSKNLVINTSSTPVSRKLIATYDGQIILPMRTSLLHYTNRGMNVQVPVIEPNLSKPMRIYHLSWTVKKDALVVFTNHGIYFSYDTAKTWIKPHEFNRNFPGDDFFLPNLTINNSGITDCEVYDSTRGVVLIQNHCNTKQVWVFSPLAAKWSYLDLGLEYVSLDILGKTKQGRLYAYSPEECQNYYTDDEGQNWDPYVIDGNTFFNLNFTGTSIFRWMSSDSTLHRSGDGGHQWAEVLRFKGDPKAFLDLGNGKLICFIHYYWGGDKSYQIYMSEDDGINWNKHAHLNLPINPSRFVSDRLGLIYVLGAGKVYMSPDLGKNWKFVTGFENFSSVYNLEFDESNRPLINAISNGLKGMFTMDSIGQVYQLSDRKFSYLGQGRALSLDRKEGVFYSVDFGETWTNITYNQPLDLSYRIPYFSSSFMSEDGHLYVSRKYEGIYKTVKPLVSTSNETIGKVMITPNPVRDYLSINLGDENQGASQLELINFLGQMVWQGSILGNQANIQVTGLPAGIYSLRLMKEGQLYHAEKIVKQ